MRLYLIRHPQPKIASGICYGSTDLDVLPHEQERVLSALAIALPQNLPVFSSPLRRCAGLAAGLAKKLGTVAVIHDPRLAEMAFGDWEMRAWEDIPRAEIDAWADNLVAYRPGGGESVMQMVERVQAFYNALKQHNLDAAALVCHAGTIRLLLACQRDLPPVGIGHLAAQTGHKIGYGEMLVLDC